HAVRDDVGQADLLGEPLVPVDGVEVTGGARVLDESGAVHREGPSGQLGADLDVGVGDLRRHGVRHAPSAARATSLVRAVTTCSPASSYPPPRMAGKSWPAIALMPSMVETTESRSPARTGRV